MAKFLHQVRPWLVGAATLTLGLLPQVALAADIQTVLDGRPLALEVPPVIVNESTLVPMREFLNALGAEVLWDGETSTVTALMGEKTVKAVIGSDVAYVNDEATQMPVAAQLIDGKTMIPLRFFVDRLGLSVAWHGESRTVYVATRGEALPVVIEEELASRGGAAVSRLGDQLVASAEEQLGAPYAWGGTTPSTGFDCSGFITYLSDLYDLDLPRTSYEMFDVGVPVDQADLQAGDLVFFSTYADGPSHVGIYDGGGGFIHAQSPETGVKVTALSSDYWASRYLGARRIVR